MSFFKTVKEKSFVRKAFLFLGAVVLLHSVKVSSPEDKKDRPDRRPYSENFTAQK